MLGGSGKMINEILQSPNLRLAADSNQVLNYKRDPDNYITQLYGEQLPALRTGLLNIYLSKGIIVQPHWHTNADETIYVVSGEVIASVFDIFARKLITYHLKAGQVAVFPKGWFHWFIAATDDTHVLAVFDQPTPDIVYGSDFLHFTPKEVMNRAYGVNEEDYARAISPIKESVVLGPPI